jgi:hypothetical protein
MPLDSSLNLFWLEMVVTIGLILNQNDSTKEVPVEILHLLPIL